LNLPPEFVSDFPPQKERGSSLDKIAPETLENLQKMYESLINKIVSLPKASELSPARSQSVAFSDRRYWIGGVRDVFWRVCHRAVAVYDRRNRLKESQS
jgi:hypothetical protein